MRICGKLFDLRLISYAQRAQTNLIFSPIQSITQTTVLNMQHNFCSVMCYTAII